MISGLSGTVAEINGHLVTIDVHGVGYEVRCSQGCLAKLAVGKDVRIVIQTEVKEDSIRLYGFVDQLERQVFNLLTSVKGVGAKSAADIISVIDKRELLRLVASGDLERLYQIKGIGRKTAERIVVELKDRVSRFGLEQFGDPKAVAKSSGPFAEALEALQALGFGRRDAERAIEQAESSLGVSRYDQATESSKGVDTATLIKAALNFV